MLLNGCMIMFLPVWFSEESVKQSRLGKECGMRIRIRLAVFGALALVLTGCAAVRTPGAEITETGMIIFRGEGTSVIAREGDFLSRLEAQIAAETIAKVNLLEKIKGAEIRGSVAVEDLMYQSHEAEMHVEGFLGGVTISYDEERMAAEPMTVTAIATLELTPAELRKLEQFVR